MNGFSLGLGLKRRLRLQQLGNGYWPTSAQGTSPLSKWWIKRRNSKNRETFCHMTNVEIALSEVFFSTIDSGVCYLGFETLVQTKRRHFVIFLHDIILQDLLGGILVGVPEGFYDRHFEREKGPIDEARQLPCFTKQNKKR